MIPMTASQIRNLKVIANNAFKQSLNLICKGLEYDMEQRESTGYTAHSHVSDPRNGDYDVFVRVEVLRKESPDDE